MKKMCNNCNKEFESEKSHTKYCSEACSHSFHHRREMHRRRTDEEYRKKRSQKESLRRQKKRQSCNLTRLKHNDEEKKRYRQKNQIYSDDDLKCAPRGNGTITIRGYRQITNKTHPNTTRRGTMFEHVFVMSEFLNRPLLKHENVHHKNGIRHDNRIENLELWSRSQPPGQRIEDKIKWCKEFLDEYGFDVIRKEETN